jgi:hypothetical protein
VSGSLPPGSAAQVELIEIQVATVTDGQPPDGDVTALGSIG